MKKVSPLLFLFIYAINTASAQGKLPAAFNNYNYFVEEFFKLPGYKVEQAKYDACHSNHSWCLPPTGDSVSAYVNVYSNYNSNEISEIQINFYDSIYFDDLTHQINKIFKVITDIRNIIADENFSKIPISNYKREETDDKTTLRVSTYGTFITGHSGEENTPEFESHKYHGYSIELKNPKYYIEEILSFSSDDTVFVIDDTIEVAGIEYLPEKPINYPVSQLQTYMQNGSSVITFIRSITKNDVVVISEDENYITYVSNTNQIFSKETSPKGTVNISFEIEQKCSSTDSINHLYLNIDVLDDTLNTNALSIYNRVLDTLYSFFGLEQFNQPSQKTHTVGKVIYINPIELPWLKWQHQYYGYLLNNDKPRYRKYKYNCYRKEREVFSCGFTIMAIFPMYYQRYLNTTR
jgi:hypothetical protein